MVTWSAFRIKKVSFWHSNDREGGDSCRFAPSLANGRFRDSNSEPGGRNGGANQTRGGLTGQSTGQHPTSPRPTPQFRIRRINRPALISQPRRPIERQPQRPIQIDDLGLLRDQQRRRDPK